MLSDPVWLFLYFMTFLWKSFFSTISNVKLCYIWILLDLFLQLIYASFFGSRLRKPDLVVKKHLFIQSGLFVWWKPRLLVCPIYIHIMNYPTFCRQWKINLLVLDLKFCLFYWRTFCLPLGTDHLLEFGFCWLKVGFYFSDCQYKMKTSKAAFLWRP